jgi:hypothetical protein
MMRRLAPAAFVEAVAHAQLSCSLRTPARHDAGEAARFAAERLLGAPAPLRIGLLVLVAGLQAQVLLCERTVFTTLSPPARRRWVVRWSASPLPGLAALLDAVAGLALTRCYEPSAAT